MKYLKTYDKLTTVNYSDLDKIINKRIKSGDYVVVLNKQLKQKTYELGRITEIVNQYTQTYTVFLFDRGISKWIFRTEIVYHSKSKEECELFIAANKYNL